MFHGLRAVAPLKQSFASCHLDRHPCVPRLESRGPIEATSTCSALARASRCSTASEPWPYRSGWAAGQPVDLNRVFHGFRAVAPLKPVEVDRAFCYRRVFHGFAAVAPLKHRGTARPRAHALVFHGFRVVAPLKQPSPHVVGVLGSGVFHGFRAVAPSKRLRRSEWKRATSCVPRLQRRGPIEAPTR